MAVDGAGIGRVGRQYSTFFSGFVVRIANTRFFSAPLSWRGDARAPPIATTQDSSAVLGARPRNARGIEPLRMWMWRRPRPPSPCRVVRVHRCRQISHSAGSFPTTRAWGGWYDISSLTELFCRSKNGLGRFGERLVGHGVEPPCRWALHLTLGLSVPFPELFFSSEGGYHLRASSGVLLMPSPPDDGWKASEFEPWRPKPDMSASQVRLRGERTCSIRVTAGRTGGEVPYPPTDGKDFPL